MFILNIFRAMKVKGLNSMSKTFSLHFLNLVLDTVLVYDISVKLNTAKNTVVSCVVANDEICEKLQILIGEFLPVNTPFRV